jgi:hypothetical protein
MKPDELMWVWVKIIREIFGAQGQFRQEHITKDEWHVLDATWESLYLREEEQAK